MLAILMNRRSTKDLRNVVTWLERHFEPDAAGG